MRYIKKETQLDRISSFENEVYIKMNFQNSNIKVEFFALIFEQH